jgi:hypothetical protein
MTAIVMSALSIAPQAWRNGGGATRELLAWPSAADWQVRISLADIDRDGAFSQFTGVQRWFGVVNGSGVVLDFDGRQVVQTIASDALQFDGALTPHCRLLSGATQDMNLMLRAADARHGAMDSVVSDQVWSNVMPLRALFTTTAGVWTDGLQSKRMQAFDFLYSVDAGAAAWRFDADATTKASTQGSWWLGANINDSKDLA